MSTHSDVLTRLTNDAQRLAVSSGEHQLTIQTHLAACESAVSQVELALTGTCGDTVARRSLEADLVRRTASLGQVRRFCLAARDQHRKAQDLADELQRARSSTAAGLAPPPGVLVVEDYDDLRELVSFVLREAGFIVRTASNGLEAVIAAYEMRPDVILMDIAMPVLDGVEATRLIRALDAMRDARVIAYTANGLDDSRTRGLFTSIIQKPSAPDVVLAAVQDCVRR